MPSRRQYLGTAAVGLCAVLAGCADPAGALHVDHATTDRIVDAVARVVESPDGRERELLDGLAENETATIEATRPPFDDDRPLAYQGSVYAVTATAGEERTRRDYLIEADFDPEETDGTEIAFEDLPAVDAERVERLLATEPPESEGYDAGIEVHYPEAAAAESVLVPDQEVEVVLVEGDPVRVRTRPTETTVTTFEYAVDERLGSVETVADDRRREHAFELVGLTDDERAVVDEAVEEGSYYASSTDDVAFEGVARALLDHDPLHGDEGRATWLAEYDGSTYVAELHLVQYGELRDELSAT